MEQPPGLTPDGRSYARTTEGSRHADRFKPTVLCASRSVTTVTSTWRR